MKKTPLPLAVLALLAAPALAAGAPGDPGYPDGSIPIRTVDDWTNVLAGARAQAVAGIYALTADLDFTDVVADGGWPAVRVDDFQGTLFGQGHTIRGFTASDGGSATTAALFDRVSNGAEIRDLTVVSSATANGNSTLCLAGLAANIGDGTLVSNCHAVVDWQVSNPLWANRNAGPASQFYGLVRTVAGVGIRIVDCSVEGTLAGGTEACGFVGAATMIGGEIARCAVYAKVSTMTRRLGGDASGFAGAIALDDGATIRECLSAGVVDAQRDAHGFALSIDFLDGTSCVRDCYSTAEVVARNPDYLDGAFGFVQSIMGPATMANVWFGGTARGGDRNYGFSGPVVLTTLENCAFVKSDETTMLGTDGVAEIEKDDRLRAASWAGYDLDGTWSLSEGETTPYFSWSLKGGAFRALAFDERRGTAISHPDAAAPGTAAPVAGDTDQALAVESWRGAAGFADATAPETTFLADNHRTIRCTWRTADPPAPWAGQTVTFDANGGSPATQLKEYTPSGKYAPLAEEPTLADRVFGGWFTLPEGGSRITAETTVTPAGMRTFYAHWRAFQAVAFDPNGGTCGTDGATFEVGLPYGPLPAASRAGWRFLGWFDAAEGGTQATPATEVAAPGARTLYAHWESNGGGDDPDPVPPAPVATTYRVQFNANGGTGTMTAQTIPRDATAALTANAFTRSGYIFIGWAKTKTGAVAYANGASVKNLAAAGGSATLYAKWAKKTYKVKFVANGGTLPPGKKMSVQKFTYGKAKRLTANKFKREGYAFKGWATSKAKAKKGKVKYKNKKKVKNLVTTGKTVRLYAVWKKK